MYTSIGNYFSTSLPHGRMYDILQKDQTSQIIQFPASGQKRVPDAEVDLSLSWILLKTGVRYLGECKALDQGMSDLD